MKKCTLFERETRRHGEAENEEIDIHFYFGFGSIDSHRTDNVRCHYVAPKRICALDTLAGKRDNARKNGDNGT